MKLITLAAMVILRVSRPNGKTLLLITERLSLSISFSTFTRHPLFLSQWILISTSLSDILVSISGRDVEWLTWWRLKFSSDEDDSSSAKILIFFTKIADSIVFFATCPSRIFTRSSSCFTYLMASERIVALSACRDKRQNPIIVSKNSIDLGIVLNCFDLK